MTSLNGWIKLHLAICHCQPFTFQIFSTYIYLPRFPGSIRFGAVGDSDGGRECFGRRPRSISCQCLQMPIHLTPLNNQLHHLRLHLLLRLQHLYDEGVLGWDRVFGGNLSLVDDPVRLLHLCRSHPRSSAPLLMLAK